MRSSFALLLLVACAKPDQIKQCFPVSSWHMPVFKCAGDAPAPAPVVVEKEPEPPPPVEPPPPAVEGKADKIELNEKVNCEYAKAELLPASKTLLDQVAKILDEHPEIEKVRIEGHTDNEASDGYNKKLSNNRAKAVRAYLISKGINGKRMEAKGFGESTPIADNTTPEGREQNRRVEIHIVKRKDK